MENKAVGKEVKCRACSLEVQGMVIIDEYTNVMLKKHQQHDVAIERSKWLSSGYSW